MQYNNLTSLCICQMPHIIVISETCILDSLIANKKIHLAGYNLFMFDQQMAVEVGVLQVAVSWVVVVGVGLPQVVVKVALPQVAMAGVPQVELAVGVSQAAAQGTAVAVAVAARQVQCSIETHVLCNASTHHNVWHSMCI